MKKIVFVLVTLITLSGVAQEKKKQRMDLTPKQAAELQVKEMTLKLDLNAAQQEKVERIALEQAKKRAEIRGKKEELKAMSDDEKHALRIARLDEQIAVQEQMKSILNKEQYTQWKELRDKRAKMVKKKMKHHKERRKERG